MLANNKKGRLILIAVAICLGILILIYYNKPTYGNSEESIIELIYDSKLVNRDNGDVYIVDIKDIGASRIVGFCTTYGKTGLIQFEANDKGNYVRSGADVRNDEIGKFVAWVNNTSYKSDSKSMNNESDSDGSFKTLYVLVAGKTEGYTAKLVVNDGYEFEGNIPKEERTMLVFEMPKTSASAYIFNLKLFDSNGNIID